MKAAQVFAASWQRPKTGSHAMPHRTIANPDPRTVRFQSSPEYPGKPCISGPFSVVVSLSPLFVSQSEYDVVFFSFSLSLTPLVYLSTYIYPAIYVPIHLSIYLPICLVYQLAIYVCIYVAIYLFDNLYVAVSACVLSGACYVAR